MQNRKEEERYRNFKNNAAGKSLEKGIEIACAYYEEEGKAAVNKTPEPFRVLSKNKQGIFKGRFTAKAQPDFQGTLKNGKSIIFEAKYTSTDTIKQNVITEKQAEVLEAHYQLGARVGVCVGIKDRYFFVPWEVWRDMKLIIGKKSVRVDDLSEWEVPWKKGVMFLENNLI